MDQKPEEKVGALDRAALDRFSDDVTGSGGFGFAFGAPPTPPADVPDEPEAGPPDAEGPGQSAATGPDEA